MNSPSPASLLGGFPGGATGSPIQVSINVVIMSILGGIGVQVSALKPLPLLTAAMIVLVFLPGGLVRFGIRAGRNVLAVSRAEDPEEPLFDSFEDSALGETVENYRQDMTEITGKT